MYSFTRFARCAARVAKSVPVISTRERSWLSKDGKPFVSWDEVHANFQFWSLFTRTFVFSEISTSHPFVRVQVNPDYSLNFSDIIEKLAKLAAATPKSDKPSRPLALRIDVMKISAARLAATDLTTKSPFSKVIGPLELTLQNFATDPDNKNPYSLMRNPSTVPDIE